MIAKGVLYEHRARPTWGPGLVVCIGEGKADVAFADGEVRTIRAPERYLSVVEGEAPEPVRRAARRRPKRKPAVPRGTRASDWPDDELRQMFAEGLSDREIADRMNRTYHAIRNRRWRLGLQRPKARISSEIADMIVALNLSGKSVRQIKKVTGASTCGIEGVIRRAGLDHRIGKRRAR